MRQYAIRSWLVAVLAGTGTIFGLAAELPALDIPVCDKPPLLDGKLNDPAWQKSTEITNLYLINSDTPARETTLFLVRDNAWLYIGAHCRNTNMPYVMQLAREHVGSVIRTDSLEIFIRPTSGSDDPYYHLMLNFANKGAEQHCNKAGLRDTRWNPPWRTVTSQSEKGWIAEIAIPLYVLKSDDLSALSINICRNYMDVRLDPAGAIASRKIVGHTLRSDNNGGYHNFANFQAVSGMGGFKPEIPFAPQVIKANITGKAKENGKMFYDIKMVLDIAQPVTGTVELNVLEDFGEGEVVALSQPLELTGRTELNLKIPAGDLQARKVKIAVMHPADGRRLAEYALARTDLIKDVILKDKHPFFRKDCALKVRTATFVVAASDSSDHVKTQSDFICDGLDDHVVINAAIEALPATGGRVHLTAGTFSIGGVEGTYGGISILRSNVLLTGEGSGTRLILQSGLTDINVIWIYGDICNITIRDLYINGNGENHNHNRKNGWKGCNGIKAIDRGISPTPRNVRVENCRIEDCRLMAVMLIGTAVEVLNCYFTGTFGSHVIELLGHSGRIEGCTLLVRDGDRAGYGFSTDASDNYHIINNKILIEPGGTISAHPINNWPSLRYGGGKITNLYHGIISGNIVINNGTTRSVLIDGYMDMVHNNIFRGVPVVIGAPLGGIGVTFEHNMLINGALEINSPLRGDECRIYINGNQFFNSSVQHKDGNVVWGTNPGYVPEKQP